MSSDKIIRHERLGKALRANLSKRKNQQRQRESVALSSDSGNNMAKENSSRARRSSRMAAVQALYQIEQNQQDVSSVVNEFMTHHFTGGNTIFEKSPDVEFFKILVNGVHTNTENVDETIQQCLQENWSVVRLSSVMRNLLRSAAYELLYEPLVPTPVILNEYIEVGKDFFQGREVGFVNGILDAIAKKVRQ
jgi:transcription antitermination protein NusB